MGLFYPLERQHHGSTSYIDDVGGSTGLVMHSTSVTATVTEIREKPMRKMTRHVSNVGRQVRKLSGELGWRASKLLRMNTAPNIVRNKQHEGFDLEAEWQLNGQVDLGREVDDVEWRRNIDQGFPVVEREVR